MMDSMEASDDGVSTSSCRDTEDDGSDAWGELDDSVTVASSGSTQSRASLDQAVSQWPVTDAYTVVSGSPVSSPPVNTQPAMEPVKQVCVVTGFTIRNTFLDSHPN